MKGQLKQGILKADNFKYPERYIGKDRDKIVYRSSWEYSFMTQFLDSPSINVEGWNSEEFIVHYRSVDGRMHRYFLDFYVKFKAHNGETWNLLIEIKPYNQTIRPKMSAKSSKTRKTLNSEVETYKINQLKWQSARQLCKQKTMNSNEKWFFWVLHEHHINFVPMRLLKKNSK